jgi:hypothetical protein
VKVDVAARCSVLAAASMASTHVATAIRAWRTERPATVTPLVSAASVRTDWGWRLRTQEGR